MSRSPSDKTLLASERRISKELREQLRQASIDVSIYRGRAQKAEQELAEWKARFDKLLERTPKLTGEG